MKWTSPFERVGEEQEKIENRDQIQMHTAASTPTFINGVGEPERSQHMAIHQGVHVDQMDSAQALQSLQRQRQERNKTEPGEELSYILGIISYDKHEKISSNEVMITWLSERIYM